MWGIITDWMAGGARRRRAILILAIIGCVVGGLTAVFGFSPTKLYFTGEQVNAQVTDCRYVNPRRKPSYYACNGMWTLKNGAKGSGELIGMRAKHEPNKGTLVAVLATEKKAHANLSAAVPTLFVGGILVFIASTSFLVQYYRHRRPASDSSAR